MTSTQNKHIINYIKNKPTRNHKNTVSFHCFEYAMYVRRTIRYQLMGGYMEQDYLQTKGRIFDIQRYSIHDGPGIRTIIFLKGCVLRCKWCCNPESQRYEIETMMRAGEQITYGRDVTVAQMLDEAEQDRMYYRKSGGGVTLSGGESLCQPDFGSALLRGLHARGIHTAMESMGCAEFSTVKRFLEHLDLYLMDIKHMEPDKHKAFTGRSNELMLENAKKIATSGYDTKLIIRVPVIPTFNATPMEIRAIAQYAASLPGVEELHLLPYHQFGRDKYEGLGRPYPMGDVEPPSPQLMQELLAEVKRAGLKGQIGG